MLLSGGEDAGADGKARPGQALLDSVQVQGSHGAVGDDGHMAGGHQRPQMGAAGRQQARGDGHAVGGSRVYLNGFGIRHWSGLLLFLLPQAGDFVFPQGEGRRRAVMAESAAPGRWGRFLRIRGTGPQFPPAAAFNSRPSFKSARTRSASRAFRASE